MDLVGQKVISNLFIIKLVTDASGLVPASCCSSRSLHLRSQWIHVRTI